MSSSSMNLGISQPSCHAKHKKSVSLLGDVSSVHFRSSYHGILLVIDLLISKRPIPRGRLEKADCVDTKNLLVDTYGKEAALDVAVAVFQLIGLMGPASDLKKRRGQDEIKTQYMKLVKEDFQRIKEHNSRMGEAVSLQARYTQLLMGDGYPDREDKRREIVSKERRHIQSSKERSSSEYPPSTLHALFDPDKDGIVPKVVVLHGPSGIGKTWTSRKIMLNWASGNLYQDKFDFVFYLSCRELNTITRKMSLVRLLSKTCSLSSGDLESILRDSKNHGRLLFVIDGFDEFQWTLEGEVEASDDLEEETHKEVLIQRLLRKQALKQSSLLITTRSLAQKKLKTFIHDPRYIELRGFSINDQKKYFYNSFEKKDVAEKVISVIEDNDILFVMCTVPLLCWMVCTVLKQEIKKGLHYIQYKTTTAIYLLYLEGLMIYHGRNQPIHICLKKLCALANEGVLKQKILFEEKDLAKHGLSVSEVESVFLNENIFHVSIKTQNCYSFIHLSVQEFLAALYYVLDDEDEDGASGERNEVSLPKICKEDSLPELCEIHPHLSLAVRFLFGLLYEKQLNEFSESTGCKISLRARSAVEEWLTGDKARSALERWITLYYSCSSIDVISCLYETQNEDLIGRAMPRSSCLTLQGLWKCVKRNKNNIKQLCYCLKLCECPLTLFMYGDQIYSEDQEIFFPLLHMCQRLVLEGCRLSPLCWIIFCSSLILNRSLTKLAVSNIHLEDSGVRHLCAGLRDPSCTLQELSFWNCQLSPVCCNELRSALVTNRSLTNLNLSWNPLKDSGVKRLCKGLRDPGCTLQELSLQKCDFLSCDDLHSVFATNQFLTKLDLSWNHLGDSGVTRLCKGLSDPGCSLQELSLRQCQLSPLCCDVFSSALVTNRSLTKLDLSENRLEDSGIKLLCNGLRDPRCLLKELRLNDCGATLLGCRFLRSVITTNQALTYMKTSLQIYNETLDLELSSWREALRPLSCSVKNRCWIVVKYIGGSCGQ
ncbi:NACHT, LRR and PYD domains-containing protein 3-like [Gastrophryne carolinensis]